MNTPKDIIIYALDYMGYNESDCSPGCKICIEHNLAETIRRGDKLLVDRGVLASLFKLDFDGISLEKPNGRISQSCDQTNRYFAMTKIWEMLGGKV